MTNFFHYIWPACIPATFLSFGFINDDPATIVVGFLTWFALVFCILCETPTKTKKE
jgi:hypothetical protein